ncbi:hypothetical protein CDAR_468741 [Caerostris darwini]|uniref:Uncharacterized protein n=1 Tax=Caerostris darwini TaxID=1538125 RepID=A0AAV4TC76_9ARAC|nr:hypothetical protein CDAR_468741 [Caerostris darwini]
MNRVRPLSPTARTLHSPMALGAIKTLSINQPAKSKGAVVSMPKPSRCVWLKARMTSSQLKLGKRCFAVNDTKQRRRNVNLTLAPFRSLLADE